MINFKLQNVLNWKQDILHLIYPNICLICENELPNHQNNICSFCQSDLQFTFFERYKEPTLLDQLFWGRIPIVGTYSLLYFEKRKSAQPILHALKYKDRPEIGCEMGSLIGEKIKDLDKFKDLDALIPVPLHPKKLFTRGYNQSEKLADGISNILNIPVDIDFIQRFKQSETQTKKNRFLRWDNVQNKFLSISNKNYKHIAVVDDVITTGATLEAIIRVIIENNPEIRVSIISLALTK
jgi:competence protein ComFC